MGTIQDKILNANDRIKRVLRDEKIRISGNEFRSIKFSADIEKDIFEDVEDQNYTSTYEEIPVIISELIEIPLSRLRKDLSVQQTESKQSLYLYDVLPIEIKSRFVDEIEKDDILVIKIYDERNEKTSLNKPFYLTLQITETIGAFSPKSLTNMKFNAAPYTAKFTQDIIDIIESF